MRMDADDLEDDDVPSVDVSNFVPPKQIAYGLNRGRSAPNQRKAMGTSGSGSTSVHVCTNCGSEFVKWMGRCPTCREWNTLQEFRVDRGPQPSNGGGKPSFSSRRPTSWLDGTHSDEFANEPVRVTDIYKEIIPENGKDADFSQRERRIRVPNDAEINSVLGGGIMSGSISILGGDPGVGKSTLLLQTAGSVAAMSTPTRGIGMGMDPEQPSGAHRALGPVWYISGEENAEQIASRALRLGIDESELWLLSETHADTLAEQVVTSYQPQKVVEEGELISGQKPKPPALLVIDSIQTMVCDAAGSGAPGGITQVRECVALFLRLAKSTGIPIILVGHVTKTGDVAGPRTVEHMVDCVLYLEGGDSVGGSNLRILRASKNRFGSSDEVGVYEMTEGRLCPVSDPSSLFLSNRITTKDSEGCAISLVLEGHRSMTVEVQALVTPVSSFGAGFGRRTVGGISPSRILLLIGVLQKRCGMHFSKQDVYVNVVGGIQLQKGSREGSAADLAAAIALVSSLTSIPVRADTAFVGEVGLLGELRPVSAIEKRIGEAARMGLSRIVTPCRRNKRSSRAFQNKESTFKGIEWIECKNLMDAIKAGLVAEIPKRKEKRKPRDSAKQTPPPGSIEELMLDDNIDDGEDEENAFE